MNSSEKNGAFFLFKNPAVLLLSNGDFFEGYALGAIGTSYGELCFNTGMIGYQEILTDPSYFGQIILMTYPHIGNYGINKSDVESDKIQAAGFIVKEASAYPSNYKSEKSISQYLQENKTVGIQGLDTRAITRIIRDQGSMNAVISSDITDRVELNKILNKIPNMNGLNLAHKVTCTTKHQYLKPKEAKYKVAVIDFGIKNNILRILHSSDCDIMIFPENVDKSEIEEFNPNGVFLSNGPGDPSANIEAIECIKLLLGKYPIFGICLGHQLLCLALGAKTYKLKYGHRGANHPVKNLKSGKIEITSQNHGFSVELDSLPPSIAVTHINLNDGTIAGISSEGNQAYSVQYHPESAPGPHDSRYLFDNFIHLMKENK